ncbi:ferritin-like domain-containing protein [Arundinibacter roseus]|uniref:Ferritin-like domain-containing protein n=1 Tax=Arundinibacter roseus TaxID=2070510 RepID=A0A4R4K9V5_9BACT|nr:ferritin-like domain-containing protein [Arundinibacter roseus]TDB63422.1 ferritin-like domain-containing protein [Arundinibacter roseus]
MNIFKIIDEIQKVDGDAVDRLEYATRRSFLTKFSRNLSAAAVPAVMATIVNKAYAQSPAAIDVLNFALTLEYLEDEFYKMGNAASGLIPSMYQTVFRQIGKHEDQHVKFLAGALGAQAVAKPTFDFSAGGAFPNPFSNFDTFVFLSHAFEDTGVRAYKGQAGNLINDPALLEYALQIHSVEARHAAKARAILSEIRGNADIKPWITLNEGSPAQVYAGDDNTVQGGVDINGIAGKSKEAITEAFDEPLTKDEVLAIASLFIV